MSNFICPHCQQIIDDGSDGFTSNREIELEKKLEIAVKALEEYANEYSWYNYENWNNEVYVKCIFDNYGYEKAQEALAKIKEIK